MWIGCLTRWRLAGAWVLLLVFLYPPALTGERVSSTLTGEEVDSLVMNGEVQWLDGGLRWMDTQGESTTGQRPLEEQHRNLRWKFWGNDDGTPNKVKEVQKGNAEGTKDTREINEGQRVEGKEKEKEKGLVIGKKVEHKDVGAYLNDLVDSSVAKANNQECNIAFAKTHKTGSTTLATILMRYALRHKRELASLAAPNKTVISLDEAVSVVKKTGRRVDIMHYHFSTSGEYRGYWAMARKKYEQIMRDPKRINYVTVLREPTSHLISTYYYYLEPVSQEPIGKFLESHPQKSLLTNPMSAEFGIKNENHLKLFIKNQLPTFKLVMLTERFDEGLLLLRRMLGWDMMDITYSALMRTRGGTRRYDGKLMKDPPKFNGLPKETQENIRKRTELDAMLFNATMTEYNKHLEEYGPGMEADLAEFRALQAKINEYLDTSTSSEAKRWYRGNVRCYGSSQLEVIPF